MFFEHSGISVCLGTVAKKRWQGQGAGCMPEDEQLTAVVPQGGTAPKHLGSTVCLMQCARDKWPAVEVVDV